MKNSEKILLLALFMLSIGVIIDLLSIFGKNILPGTLIAIIQIISPIIILISVYIIIKKIKS